MSLKDNKQMPPIPNGSGIKIRVGGIKCDNPKCNWRDDSVLAENYYEYLNKPCPKCGCNLLTEEDLEAVITILKFGNSINRVAKYFPGLFKGEEKKGTISFDGTGRPKMEISDDYTFDKEGLHKK